VAITNAIQSLQKIKNPIKLSKNPSKKQANFSLNQITVSGLEKLMNNLSQCCNPLPPEKIQGYITLQKGISIHRQDCRNLLNMAKNTPERIIEVNWTSTTNKNNYPINLEVIAYDRRDLLRDISNILSEEKISVSNINSSADKNSMLVKIQLHIMVPNLPSLSRLMVRFEQLKNIVSVTRQ
jgi:GTP pyrophosphokinase